MQKLVELLNTHWDYILDNNTPEENTLHTPEIEVAKCMGKSVLINNMNMLNINKEHQQILLEKYDSIFGPSLFDHILPLNFKELINPLQYDVIGRVYESHIHHNGTRKSSGQFYSPIEAVSYIVESLNLDGVNELESKRFIDIACGTGVFLLSALKEYSKALRNKGFKEEDVLELALENIYGLDINPVSCTITKINLFNFIVIEFSPEQIMSLEKIDFNIFNTNSIENRTDIFSLENPAHDHKIKNKLDDFSSGFHYIIGNPPYLEAKKMPKELKEICKANYSEDIFGAFDLYIAFLSQCNRLVAEDGIVSLILPNKFTVARYAMKIRAKLLNHFTLLELTDLSEMDIFSKADVYPIVFTYKNSLPLEDHKVRTKMSVKNYHDLFHEAYMTYVPQSLFQQIGEMNTFFCLPKKGAFGDYFVKLFSSTEKISKYLEFRSTVSFHKKGLREKYVSQEFDDHVDSSHIRKYLGGQSYSKKNEVGRYKIDWNQYYINYNNAELKSIGNPLPPIGNFERPKIIFCQHAPEIIATLDETGEWVTKDVFPIAFAKDDIHSTNLSVKYLTGLLNSKLYSFIYGIIYKGIQIAGGYYHFLPTWMSILPIIIPTEEIIKKVESLVDQALANPDDYEAALNEIDEIIFMIYSISEEQKEEIYSFFGYKPLVKK